VPFGIYTSGIMQNGAGSENASKLSTDLKINTMEVTLGAGDPKSYGKLANLNEKSATDTFGKVCNFIITSVESGFPTKVGIAGGTSAGAASDLARALGAIEVSKYK